MPVYNPPTNYPAINAQIQTGVWQRANLYKDGFNQPQIYWTTPTNITFTGHTGTFQTGETVTGATSGATGILVYKTATVLMIRPVTGAFLSYEQVSGATSGAATTSVTSTAFIPSTPYVWSRYKNRTGILAFNGGNNTCRRGGATVGPTTSLAGTMYGTLSGIYYQTVATESVCTYPSESASFTLGEPVTQATTLAVGSVYLDNNTNTLTIEVSSGTFASGYVITGSISGSTCTPSAVTNTASVNWLEWSPDGWTNFVPVCIVNNPVTSVLPTFPHYICDCGIIAGPINGHSNVRVILQFDYGEGGSRIRYCLPDINPYGWTVLWQNQGSGSGAWPSTLYPIRHYHGAVFIPNSVSPGISPYEGELWVMCGDADYACALVRCNNVADLCNNPTNWQTNWGMNVCGPARCAWFQQSSTVQYTLGYSAKSGSFTKGEQVHIGSQVGFFVSDSGSALTVNSAPGATFPSTGTLTGSTSGSTASLSTSSHSSIGGGANYAVGNNSVVGLYTPGYPSLAASGTILATGVQGTACGQDCRSVEIAIDTQGYYGAAGTYAFFIPDESQSYSAASTLPAYDGFAFPGGINYLRMINLVTKTVTTIGTRLVGVGWVGCETPQGPILLTTESDHTAVGGTAYYPNCDQYCRIYQVGTDLNSAWPVANFTRSDYQNPNASPATISSLFPAFGAIFGWDAEMLLEDGDPIGVFEPRPSFGLDALSVGRLTASPSAKLNWVEGGRFNQTFDAGYWSISGLAHFGSNPNVLDLDEGGNTPYGCIQVDIASGGGGTYYAQYALNTSSMYALRGKFVTLSMRVKAPTSLNAAQAPYIALLTDTNDTSYTPISLSDSWQTVTTNIFLNVNQNTLYIHIIPDLYGLYTGSIYISDVRITEGANPAVGLVPSRNLVIDTNLAQSGNVSLTVTSTTFNITQLNLEYRQLTFTGSPVGNQQVVFPNSSGTIGTLNGLWWQLVNNTGVGLNVVKTGHPGFWLWPNESCICFCNGTDMQRLTTGSFVDGSAAIGSPQTSVNGSVSGSAVFVMPLQGYAYKKVVISLASLNGTASYTFPTAFVAATPAIIATNGLASTVVTALSTTAVTVTGSTQSGWIVLEGF